MNIHFTAPDAFSADHERRLLIEISPRGVYALVLDNDQNCLALLGEPGTGNAPDTLKRLVAAENILQESFTKINILYGCPESVLVPQEFMPDTHRKELLELVHGEQEDIFLRTDYMYRQGIRHLYSVSRPLDAVVSYLFSSALTHHLYSLLPEMYRSEGSHLHCLLGAGYCTVMLTAGGNLQAIQTYHFQTPEDVTYHLLQLCEAYRVPLAGTWLHLGGMVDENSALYQSLYSFFPQVAFLGLPEGVVLPETLRAYPEHYFSHLFAAAQCV